MKIQRRNNKNNRRHLSIKSLALMALFLFSVVVPIAGTWGAKARAAEVDGLAKTWGINVNNGKVEFKATDIKSAVWINANEVVVTFANNKTATFYPEKDGDKTPLEAQRAGSMKGGGLVTYKSKDFGSCYAKINWDLNENKGWDNFIMTELGKTKIDIDFRPSGTSSECTDGEEPDISFASPKLSIAYFSWVDSDRIAYVDGDQNGRFTRVTGSNYFFRDKEVAGTACRDKLLVDVANNKATYWELSKDYIGNAPPEAQAADCKYYNTGWLPSNIAIFITNKKDSALPAGQGKLPNNTSGSTGSTGDPGEALPDCDVKLLNPLTWFVCPMIETARELVNSLNDAINDMLTLPTDRLFVTSETDTGKPANLFYDSWSGFRYIAMGLLVIIALIMVLSQAIGVGPFDAYTIRKVLPRLLAAVVLVSLSWPLMKLAVDITNGIGHSVSGLIYSPFEGQLKPGNPSSPFMGAVFTGVIASGFVFGLVGLLAFVATAALSMISGMATLIFREMLIMFLVVVAPVAIVCSILPNTQTVWKKWSDYFLRALIVFPIFSGVIAIGQVFAVIGKDLHENSVGDLIQFIGYFGPYFMLPKIFAMSGGAVAAVGSVAQKATAGMRGGLKNFSQNRRKQIHEKRMDATSRLGGSSAGGVYRRLASGGAHGSWSMREGGREKWKAQEKKTLATSSEKMLKEGGDAAFSDDDASSLLRINGQTRQGFIDGYTRGGRHTETEAHAALGRAEIATGTKVGTTAMATAANAYRHSVSKTAFTADAAGKLQQRAELRYAVAEGLITQNDAIVLQKSNKARLDQSGAGYNETQGFLFGTGTVGPITADEHTENAFANSDPREILAAHQRTSDAFANVALDNGIAAVARGITTPADKQNRDRALADLANIHSSLSSTSPARANAFEATVLSQPSGIMGTRPDPAGGPDVSKILTWREAIDDARANEPGNPTFHDRIREYSNITRPPTSDSRLKRNIQQIGVSVSGIKIYKFQYIWSDVEYVGVLAQELLSEHRHAVIVDDSGYYKVDYSKIDVEMMLYKDWKHRVMASN